MTPEQFGAAVRRYWLMLVAIFVACFAATVAVTAALPRTYTAKATLEVGETGPDARTLDAATAQQLTRTYATLAGNPNVVDVVRRRVRPDDSRSELLSKMSFNPVGRTPLLEIGAEGGNAREAQRLANAYATLFARRIDAQLERGRALAPVTVTERAARPSSPSDPVVPLYLGAGALISLALALGAVLLRDRREHRLSVGIEDESLLGRPVLGRIPPHNARGPQLPFDDSFRLLKANLEFAAAKPLQSVLVTSPGPLEGKTTVAANLAVAAVADGDSAIVVEADLRRPRLEQALGWSRPERARTGLTNYLVGSAPLAQLVSPHPDFPGLAVIWAGPPPPNPGALLHSSNFRILIKVLSSRYDWVILDAPPVSIGADASVLAPRAGAVLCVLDMKRTSVPAAQAAIGQLERAQAALIGLVLNNAPGSRFAGYEHYAGDDGSVDLGRLGASRA
jgi:capsular exopolysaccharide synthesis family protein